MDDRDLLQRVAGRDEAAFRRLYERFGDRVFRYALSLLRNRHLAEEVCQETMIAIWNGAGRFAGRSQVSTWIFGIVRNQAFGLRRREDRGARRPDPPSSSAESADPILREVRVQEALDRLSDEHREVVHLTFYEGLSYREVSEILDIPEGTVKSRMFHARRALAKELT